MGADSMFNVAPDGEWIGWKRVPPSKRWVAVVGGASEADTWSLLYEAVGDGKVCDLTVTRFDVDPNLRRSRR